MDGPNQDGAPGWSDLLVVFVLTLLLYFGLSQQFDVFMVGTGVASALVVTAVFGRLAFDRPPAVVPMGGRVFRGALYLPYLFWEIAKANIAIAYLALHPALPIDPSMERYDLSLSEPIPTTMLALSITLTPGTLVVDVDEQSRDEIGKESRDEASEQPHNEAREQSLDETSKQSFDVHVLTAEAFDDLCKGGLERAVGFVFSGRQSEPGEEIAPSERDGQ